MYITSKRNRYGLRLQMVAVWQRGGVAVAQWHIVTDVSEAITYNEKTYHIHPMFCYVNTINITLPLICYCMCHYLSLLFSFPLKPLLSAMTHRRKGRAQDVSRSVMFVLECENVHFCIWHVMTHRDTRKKPNVSLYFCNVLSLLYAFASFLFLWWKCI